MPKDKKYYSGNEKLPTPDAKFEWTPEKVGHLKKCKTNIIYFAETFFYIVEPDKGRVKIPLYFSQKTVLRSVRDNRFVICLASRQTGKTTMMTIVALWMACFQKDQRILIVANKEQTAINIFGRIKLAYEELPEYLKPGVANYAKTSMKLGNGSSIGISTTSSDSGRGETCNLLIIDEMAFIPSNLSESFWKSVYPIISASKKSKIFIASTPNGTGNLFHKLYVEGLKNKTQRGDRRVSRGSGWVSENMMWYDVPGRDENWKEETIRSIGSEEAFKQEYDCEFIESYNTFLDEEHLRILEEYISKPIEIFEDGCYKIWEPPNQEKVYTIGVDVSEGIGRSNSVIEVFDITNLEDIVQVAEYASNRINPFDFACKLNEIAKHWGTPPLLVERNNQGGGVVDLLDKNLHYPNIVSYMSKTGKITFDRYGIHSHTNTKVKGVTNMRYWVHNIRCVKFRCKEMLEELKTFHRKPNGIWTAKLGYFDDRVMALVWALLILEESLIEQYYDVTDWDDNGRPKNINQSEYGFREFKSLSDKYFIDETKTVEYRPINPVFDSIDIMYNPEEEQNEINILQKQGWEFLK